MTTVSRPLLWPRSLGGEFLFTLFGIFKLCTVVQLLVPIVFLGARAFPTSPSSGVGGEQLLGADTTSNPSSLSSQASQSPSPPTRGSSATHTSASASASTGTSSGTSQLTDSQLTILLGGKFYSFLTQPLQCLLLFGTAMIKAIVYHYGVRLHLYIRFLGTKIDGP